MSTESRIEAARANGKLSRGPKTPEGKAISSRNAEKHGILSDMLIDGEDGERLVLLFDRLAAELQPVTESDYDMIETMAAARWRQMRLRSIEAACLNESIRAQIACSPEVAGRKPRDRAAKGFKALVESSNAIQLAARYEARFERQYSRCLKLFQDRAREEKLDLQEALEDENKKLPNEPSLDLTPASATPDSEPEAAVSDPEPLSNREHPEAALPAIRWNLPPATPDILAKIVARKREELQSAAIPLAQLRENAVQPRRDFAAALRAKSPAIISEIKKASPSRGVLIHDFRPAELARNYQKGGAAALSVLTDLDFFGGSLQNLQAARAACQIPVLRKDFTISEYHVVEAAAAGADAILLIVAILEDAELRAFRELAATFGMATLVEAHDEHELDRALASGAAIVGINNRDLRTFEVSLETSINLARRIPPGVLKVSESGIFNSADIHRLRSAGFDAFLVGEHLVRSPDPTQALQELVLGCS